MKAMGNLRVGARLGPGFGFIGLLFIVVTIATTISVNALNGRASGLRRALPPQARVHPFPARSQADGKAILWRCAAATKTLSAGAFFVYHLAFQQ